MADVRLRIQKDLEKSSLAGAVFITDSNKEGAYLPAGSNTTVLTMVSGAPAWAAPATGSSFSLSDGTNTQVINAGDTLLAQAGNGVTVLVGATDKLTYAVKLSTDSGNGVSFGSDSGIYVPQAKLLNGASWNDSTNNLVLTFVDGSTVSVPIVDNVGAFLSDFTISDGTTTDLINNHETITFSGSNKIKFTISSNTITGTIDTTGATTNDVLKYNGSAVVWGAAASTAPLPKKDEFTPASSATTVTLSATPSVVTGYTGVDIYRNGKLLQASAYSISGTTVTFTTAFGASTGADYSETAEAKYYV